MVMVELTVKDDALCNLDIANVKLVITITADSHFKFGDKIGDLVSI